MQLTPDLGWDSSMCPATSIVKNMLAGVSGIDLVLFVIAADNPSSRKRVSISISAVCWAFRRA